jgi:hypothetical protein
MVWKMLKGLVALLNCRNIAISLIALARCFLQDVHPEHPPDEEYCDDASGYVNDPVAGGFRFSKIEHSAMVAVPPRNERAGARVSDNCHQRRVTILTGVEHFCVATFFHRS